MKNIVIFLITLISVQSQAKAQQLTPCRDDSGLYGFCDQNGQIIIKHQYYNALDFIDGHAAVLIEDKWGIINDTGHLLVPPTYDEVINCVNITDQILVRVEDKWHFVNAYGIQMTNEYGVGSPWYEFELNGPDAYFNKNTWFSFIKKDKWGIVDLYDNVKLPFTYEWTRVVRSEVDGKKSVVSVILKEKNKYAWQGVVVKATTGFEFDEYLGQNDKNLFFQMGDRVVAIDAISGKRIEHFNREYYNLLDGEDSVGLVSASGKILIPFKYELVDIGRVENHVIFGNRGKLGLTDMDGKVILQPIYSEIKNLDTVTQMIAVKNNQNHVAVFSLESGTLRRITDFKYKYAVKDGDQIRISLDNRTGFLSSSGVESWKN